jgi:hypothetical protein
LTNKWLRRAAHESALLRLELLLLLHKLIVLLLQGVHLLGIECWTRLFNANSWISIAHRSGCWSIKFIPRTALTLRRVVAFALALSLAKHIETDKANQQHCASQQPRLVLFQRALLPLGRTSAWTELHLRRRHTSCDWGRRGHCCIAIDKVFSSNQTRQVQITIS